MQPVNWLKTKYNNITENKSLLGVARESFLKFKDEVQKAIFRMKHLEESNENLAYYHFDRGNINDSIFRFKLVNKVHPRAMYDFFLARLYWEKNKMDKSQIHIVKYLESAEKQYAKEAAYQSKLSKGNYLEIDSVPEFFILHNSTQFYFIFEKRLDAPLNEQSRSSFFDAIYPVINKHVKDINLKILDLNCQDGVLGYHCKRKFNCEELIGVEPLDKFAALAGSRKYKEFAIYHKIINDFYSNGMFDEKFDLILAENIIENKSSPEKMLESMRQNLSKNGILAFAFTTTTKAQQHQFLSSNEVFAFNETYIKTILKGCKLKIIEQKHVKYSPDNTKTVIIATHEI